MNTEYTHHNGSSWRTLRIVLILLPLLVFATSCQKNTRTSRTSQSSQLDKNLRSQLLDKGSLLHVSRLYIAPMTLGSELRSSLPQERRFFEALRDAAKKELDIEIIADEEDVVSPPLNGDIAHKRSWLRKKAQRKGAQAILFTRLNQYQDRVGSKVGLSKPGKVNFEMSIYTPQSQTELWNASYHYVDRVLSDDFLKARDYIKQRTDQSNKSVLQIFTDGMGEALRDFSTKRSLAFQ